MTQSENESMQPQGREITAQDLVVDELGRQIGAKAVEATNWMIHAKILEGELIASRQKEQELQALVKTFEAGAVQSLEEDEAAEEEESPTKE